MPTFLTTSTAPRPPAETFAYVTDLSRWPSFQGYGPLPGIVRAELPDGGAMELGARVRVTNTDGSVHHEVVVEFVPGARYRVRMELGPPGCYLIAHIDETVDLVADADGTRILRRFDVVARHPFSAPIAWLVGRVLLPRAVARHNDAVAAELASGRGAP